VSSTQHYQIVYHNITACISPPYLLLTGHIMIAERNNRTPYSCYDITCEHCILTNCINNSRLLDQKKILIVKQSAFLMLPVQINGTWYDNPGVQPLLEIEKALARCKRVIGGLGCSSVVSACLACVKPWVRSQHQKRKDKKKRVIGLVIGGVLALVSLIASGVASTVTLSQSIQTAHYVNPLATNVSLILISQEAIHKKVETRLIPWNQ
jgi:hypothetical protein